VNNVFKEELNHQLVDVQMVNMLTKPTSVEIVMLNVKLALTTLFVLNVLKNLSEVKSLIVYVLMDILILVLKFVKLVLLNVKHVTVVLPAVLIVLNQESMFQNVFVHMENLNLKDNVMIVPSNVMVVLNSLIIVKNVLETELILKSVTVLQVFMKI